MSQFSFAFPKPGTKKLLVGASLGALIGITALLASLLVFVIPMVQRPLLDAFIREKLGHDPATWAGTQWTYAAGLFVAGIVMFTFAAIASGIFSWYERKVAARMQSRIGPNRVGAGGFLQWIADAVKLLFKEDLVPGEADALIFRSAPYFLVAGMVLVMVALPAGQAIVVADLDVGIFYILAVTSFIVVGIILSGWSSNSKWSLFGAIRATAQIISYEIPAGLAIMVPVLMAGTLSTQGLIQAQGGWPWEWFFFRNPAAAVAFFILFISQLAEGNRTPFDLAEAESELVAGYFSEYSGFRYALYFMVEWANLWIIGAVATTLFLGGWQIPGVGTQTWAALRGSGSFPAFGWWVLQYVSLGVFALKTLSLVTVIIWIRWTLPRIRIDQMMTLCWKYLVPAGFAAMLFTLLWQMVATWVPVVERVTALAVLAATLYVTWRFLVQTRKNVSLIAHERIDLSNW
ncbi:MAG: dehydrogenase (quinone) [Anaeromyxobacteraceae bacterium]|jgi:NADH-quinone oxidoreductase subunit H|nr:dehydrogenase (quinone) [Anaeromyxobacteraceae bacterium]